MGAVCTFGDAAALRLGFPMWSTDGITLQLIDGTPMTHDFGTEAILGTSVSNVCELVCGGRMRAVNVNTRFIHYFAASPSPPLAQRGE